MKKKYLCKLSKNGFCRYGGNKHYNYGFVSGMASYCRKAKMWVVDLKKCPLRKIKKCRCLNCGTSMKQVKDFIAKKFTGHLWRCPKCKIFISKG